MSLTYKADHNFGELKKALFTTSDTPYMVWRETHNDIDTAKDVDVLEHMRFNIEQLKDLNSRFQFLMEELSTVLVKKKR
jgi:hypothetical protein